KVLDHDIGRGDHALEDVETLRRLEIERHRPLVAVQVEHVVALARTAHALVAIDTGRRLDLDHVGTEIGENPAAVRTGAHAGQVENANVGQCGRSHGARHAAHPFSA